MTPENYLEQMAALGIGRGNLAEGFPLEDVACVGALKQPEFLRRARKKVSRETLGLPVEDLTHLNPPRSATAQVGIRAGMQRYWGGLKAAERTRPARARQARSAERAARSKTISPAGDVSSAPILTGTSLACPGPAFPSGARSGEPRE